MIAHPPALDPAFAAWPTDVRVELARRRAEVEQSVAQSPGSAGRVLDLADADARRLVMAAAAAGDGTPGSYDAVISIAGLVHLADVGAALVGIDHLLAPAGQFWFVEPVARPGWSGLLGATLGAALPPFRDLHLGRDIPHAVRSTGLLITDIKRFSMPTSLWPLRPFVHARAMHFPQPSAEVVA